MEYKGTLFPDSYAPAKNDILKTDRILRVFEDIHNNIYANEGYSSEQAFSEILKILFIKVYDEKHHSEPCLYIEPDEYEKSLEGKAPKAFLERVANLHRKTLLYFSDVSQKEEKINLKPPSLAYAVSTLQHINLSDSPGDITGLAFQKFVYSKQRSHRGQFFTPEPIVKLCVEMLNPKLDETILDPTCGTGGFLSEALRYVKKKYLNESSDADINKYVSNNLFGIEINPMIAKIAKMRLLLEGDGRCNITCCDALADWELIDREISKASNNTNNYENYFDIILTNPPFGSQGKIKDKSVLSKFDLGYRWIRHNDDFMPTKELQNAQVPDILFIERCLSFLKENGRLAIVLPNGDLENLSLEYVRSYIKTKAEIIAVVKLPIDTFIPFGTGVRASVIFLRKDTKIKNSNSNKVFFAKIDRIGYSANKNGTVLYKKDNSGQLITDEDGNYIVDEDVSRNIKAFNTFKSEGKLKNDDNCFIVQSDQINKRFDLDYYLPSSKKLEKELLLSGAKKLKDVLEIERKKSPKLRQKDLEVEYIEIADINGDYSEISRSSTMSVHELPSRASYEIEVDDIITAVAGNSIGTKKHMSALVVKEFKGAICTNGFRVLKAGPEIDNYYLLSFLRSELFLNQVLRYRTGAAIPAISDNDLRNILIPIPPMEIQQEISKKMAQSFKLRESSKRLMQDINITLELTQ